MQGGVWLVTCPVLGTPKLHYINHLGLNYWKWNVIIYIHDCFQINYVITFCQMVRSSLKRWYAHLEGGKNFLKKKLHISYIQLNSFQNESPTKTYSFIRNAQIPLVQKQQKESITWCGGLLFSKVPHATEWFSALETFGREFLSTVCKIGALQKARLADENSTFPVNGEIVL